MTLPLNEWYCWSPASKLELVNGQLIVDDSPAHSRLLLSHLLRGWGLDAALPLAPLPLWWQALSEVFGLPRAIAHNPIQHSAEATAWANRISFRPNLSQHEGHKGDWRWAYSRLRQDLRMAMHELTRSPSRLGESLGGGVVNRLGEDGLMPDVYFYRGEPRNQSYEYFVDGPPEVVIEFLQPGCDRYAHEVKQPIYETAAVPELWLIDVTKKKVTLLRWSSEGYQQQVPDASGQYAVSNVPGLTFLPNRLWRDKTEGSLTRSLFRVEPEAAFLETGVPCMGTGVDETKGLVKQQAQLEPEAIAFEDYIYWCPEAKFEFIKGRPWIGGREGIQGLLGMLLKTMGLTEAIKIASPQEWVAALLQANSRKGASKKQQWWNIAEQNAQFLRDQFGVKKLAVTGDLLRKEPLDYWSKLILVLWGAPEVQKPYASLQEVVAQMNKEPEIQLIFADRELSATEAELINAGCVELG